MEQITLDRTTHNLLDRLTENVGKLAEEMERRNDLLEAEQRDED